MHPSSTPPPRRSSRARQPRATFICIDKVPAPFKPSKAPAAPWTGTRPPGSRRRPLARSDPRGAGAPASLPPTPVDRDDLAAVKAFDLRLKPLRIDASRGPHVFRLEAPRFAGRQVAKDHERLDRRHLGEDALVSHDVSDVERTEADEGRHPVHLAALLLAEQLRGR